MIVGEHTYGLKHATIVFKDAASLIVGKYCSFAPMVKLFLGGNHRTDWITTYPFGHVETDTFGSNKHNGHPSTRGDIVIGNDVWVGAYATIMSGVTIGDGAVIAANAHIVKDVAPYEVVGGNPARHIRYRFEPEIIYGLMGLSWWNLPDDVVKSIIPVLQNKPDIETLRELMDRYAA